MSKFGAILLIAVIVAAILVIKQSDKNQTPTNKNIASETSDVPNAVVKNVKITKVGFEPPTISIKRGETVKWINESGGTATVNSDPSPKNDLYPFLNLGEIPNGSSSDAQFVDSGTYKYHNQNNPVQRGTVVVK